MALTRAHIATRLPVRDLQRAREWYSHKLGLDPIEDRAGGLRYVINGAEFALYVSQGSSDGSFTQLAFTVDDLRAEVDDLKNRGVVFEEVDVPGLTTVDSIAHVDGNYPSKGTGELAAWFKDCDDNMLGMGQPLPPPFRTPGGTMSVDPAVAGAGAEANASWAPAHYLPPPTPTLRADGSRHFVGVTYAVAFGFRPLQLDLWVPDVANPPLVVWIHGGAWLFGDRRYLPETLKPDQLFDELLARGMAVASVDYRLSHEAKFPAQLHDCKAAVRYLRAHGEKLGIDTAMIGVWGESAGGHLAAMVALTGGVAELEGNLGVVGPSSAVDVCVDWYGPSDLEGMPARTLASETDAILPPELMEIPEEVLLQGLDPAGRRSSAPLAHVRPDAPPFLLVHGTADRVVPLAESEALAAALTGAGASVRMVAVPGADHIFAGYADVDGLVRLSTDYLADALVGSRTQGR